MRISMYGHTWKEEDSNSAAHDLHIQGTSVSSSKTLSGISMQCWWYHVLHVTLGHFITFPPVSGRNSEGPLNGCA